VVYVTTEIEMVGRGMWLAGVLVMLMVTVVEGIDLVPTPFGLRPKQVSYSRVSF
jgi:hypothetical protein